MDSIFNLILSSSIYASVAGMVILVIKTVLKNKINPKWHYLIWLVLVLKLVIPFGPRSVLSLFNSLPQIPQQTNFTQMYEEYHQGYKSIVEAGDKSHIPTTWVVQDTSLQLLSLFEKALPYIWFVGMLVMLCWLALMRFVLDKKIKTSQMPINDEINIIMEECKRKLRVEKNVQIIVQNIIKAPSLIGIINPKILITPEILNLDKKEIAFIFQHELIHYRRKDLISNNLLLILQAIHWFNPIIWICFKKIRQDMEVATDEQVLVRFSKEEQKEYGKALLAVLESFKTTRLAPRLLSMVDDRRNMEKRIKMIKMNELFKSRRKIALLIAIISILALCGVLLTNAVSKEATYKIGDYSAKSFDGNESNNKDYSAADLVKLKIQYVGDANKVGKILRSLPFENLTMKNGLSLTTDKKPYGINVKFNCDEANLNLESVHYVFLKNATLMFSLIENVDRINLSYIDKSGEHAFSFSREDIQKDYIKDLIEYSKNTDSMSILLNTFSQKFYVTPEKYSPAMSSTPGIRIITKFDGRADSVKYTTASGNLLTWDQASGKIKNYGNNVELPVNTPVYWSPIGGLNVESFTSLAIRTVLIKNGTTVSEKNIHILNKNGSSYTIQGSEFVTIETNDINSNTFDESKAILMVIKDHPDFPTNLSDTITKKIPTGGDEGPTADVKFTTKVEKTGEATYTVTLTKDWGISVNGKYVKSFWKYNVTNNNVTLIENIDNDMLPNTIK